MVVDEQDNLFYTRAALAAHGPGEGRITVHPTPVGGSPAALAHDVLYALGKRLAPGPDSPDVWLDSVDAAWRAAAAWARATGVRHVVVLRAHLLTLRRIDQLLAWRALTGVQMTLVWQREAHTLPPVLAQVERRLSGRRRFEALLAEPGPTPARPFFVPGAPVSPTLRSNAACRAGQPAARLARETRPAWGRPERQAPACSGAMAAVHLVQAAPAFHVAPKGSVALAALAHPVIAGALSVLAFARVRLGRLRSTRDFDIAGDVSVIQIHGTAHRSCGLYAVPGWARPLLAAARAHHRLESRPAGESVFSPVLRSGARHLCAHAESLPQLDVAELARALVP
ncbi:hypothetical protein [Streptomyces cyaneofuscatus]